MEIIESILWVGLGFVPMLISLEAASRIGARRAKVSGSELKPEVRP